MLSPTAGYGLLRHFIGVSVSTILRRGLLALIPLLSLAAAPAWALTDTTTTIAVSPSIAAVVQTATSTGAVTGLRLVGSVKYFYNGTGSFGLAPLPAVRGTAGTATFSYTVPDEQTITFSACESGSTSNNPSTSNSISYDDGFDTTQSTLKS